MSDVQPVVATEQKQKYVLGFLFSADRSEVALIEHQRFEKLNGLGGKMNPGEWPLAAMTREFLEESGALVAQHEWRFLGWMEGPDYLIHCYVACGDRELQTQSEGLVRWYRVSELSGYPLMHNLSWLIQIAQDGSVSYFHVNNL